MAARRIPFRCPQAETVRAPFIDVQVKRDAVPAQGGGEQQRVFHQYTLIFAPVPHETRRGVFGDL